MRRRHDEEPVPGDVDRAPAAMNADEFRDVVRGLPLELYGRAQGRIVNQPIERAARGGSGWAPMAVSPDAAFDRTPSTNGAR
jgi:hypothetical protein